MERNKSVFRLNLGSGGPAKVSPIKITPNRNKKPVNVEVCKYPAEQKKIGCIIW